MATHPFPLQYDIHGSKKKSKSKRDIELEIEEGWDNFSCFEVIYLPINEVDEVNTIKVGTVSKDDQTNDILFFNDSFWVKDEYSEAEEKLRNSFINSYSKPRIINGKGSSYRDYYSSKSQDENLFANAYIDGSHSEFKRIFSSDRDMEIEKISKTVQRELIDVEGVIYKKVQTPVFELYLESNNEELYAGFRLNLEYNKPKDETYIRYRDSILRFNFNQKDQLDQIVDYIKTEYGIEVQSNNSAEYYFGGDFPPVNDEDTNLIVNAHNFINNDSGMKTWSIEKFTSWAKVRDTLKDIEDKTIETNDADIDNLANILMEAKEFNTNHLHADIANFKWKHKPIDIDFNFDEELLLTNNIKL